MTRPENDCQIVDESSDSVFFFGLKNKQTLFLHRFISLVFLDIEHVPYFSPNPSVYILQYRAERKKRWYFSLDGKSFLLSLPSTLAPALFLFLLSYSRKKRWYNIAAFLYKNSLTLFFFLLFNIIRSASIISIRYYVIITRDAHIISILPPRPSPPTSCPLLFIPGRQDNVYYWIIADWN